MYIYIYIYIYMFYMTFRDTNVSPRPPPKREHVSIFFLNDCLTGLEQAGIPFINDPQYSTNVGHCLNQIARSLSQRASVVLRAEPIAKSLRAHAGRPCSNAGTHVPKGVVRTALWKALWKASRKVLRKALPNIFLFQLIIQISQYILLLCCS